MMNIKYRQLKAFALAGELGSFAEAANALSITQPSFSVLIRELEHDLGMQLFERTTRRCAMTVAGNALFQEVHAVLRDLEKVYQHARDISAGSRGRLSIAAVPSLACGVVAEAIGNFHQRYPDVTIDMREDLNVSIINAVKQNEVELGVASILGPDPEVGFQPLFCDRLVVVARRGHPVMQAPVTWRTLAEHPFILLGSGVAERALQLSKTTVKLALEVPHMATAVSMARHGMGITLVPSSSLSAFNMDGLESIPMPGPLAKRELGVIYRSQKQLSAAAMRFIDVLRATVPAGTRNGNGKNK